MRAAARRCCESCQETGCHEEYQRMDYGHAGQMTLDEITGGSPYGATTIAGGDGSRRPTANELKGASYQGRKIAEIAKKLHG
jgi:NAD(P)H dehydrogenase (quinone)